MRARIAWAAVVVTAACVVLDTLVTASYAPLLSEETWAVHGWPLATLATLGCSLMGALVITRYPRHPIGWLLLVAGTASISLAAEAYGLWVLEDGGPGSDYAGHFAGWVSVLFNAPLAIAAITIIFLIAPDGHLASRRWRWAARVSLTGLVTYTAGVLTMRPGDFEFGDDVEVGALTALLNSVGILLVASALVASVVSLVLRLRRAHDETRRQLLWIVSAAAALAGGFVLLLVVSAIQGEQTLLAATPLFGAYLAFPVAVAVAVLRHRLFDIDLIVNRALVVALAAGLVAVGYVAVVVVVGEAVGGGAGGFWPSLAATALVAMAFQPLRRRVVRFADRLAFGPAAVPYEALADFSRRLGESPDPATLLPSVAEAAAVAVSARSAVVRLSVPGAPDRVATWPAGRALPVATEPPGEGPGADLPVVDRGEQLGTLSVAMPAGRELRPGEHLLLQDLADQAALAFRGARLSAELATKVEELTRSTSELAESRRRLITAADVERSRLERSLARSVAPHLEPLPGRIEELADSESPDLLLGRLEPLVTAATAALEALREITRGIFPAQLGRSGLPAALTSHLGRSGGHLVVEESVVGRRFDPRVEAAAYFCTSEATREVGNPAEVALSATDDWLELVISGPDHGDLPVASWRDRVEAADGTIASRRDGEARVLVVGFPVRTGQGASDADRWAADQTASSRSGPKSDLVT